MGGRKVIALIDDDRAQFKVDIRQIDPALFNPFDNHGGDLVEVDGNLPILAFQRPVVAGEKIMQIADPAKVELEIMLPISDAINLEPGAETVFFLNIDPQTPLGARVRWSSFRATATAEGFLAFRLKAEFVDGESPPRIGLRGTAKVFGDETSIFFFLFRRPLAKARQWLGL